MTIKTLKLTNFRNFEKYELELGKITILVGPNGVGKTNIIESVHLLSVCRSYRTRRDSEVIRWADDSHANPPHWGGHAKHTKSSREKEDNNIVRGGTTRTKDLNSSRQARTVKEDGGVGSISDNIARVSAEIVRDSGDKLLLAVAQDGDKKIAFVGDKPVPVSLVVGRLPTVLFAPEIMELPVDLPSKRRRQLDIFASQLKPNYTRLLLNYHRILKARNKLLDGIAAGRNREDELDFWDKELVSCGQKILKDRLAIVALLDKEIGICFERLNNDAMKGERILRYRYEASVPEPSQYADELQAARGRDVRYRNTTIGPHRDDWQLFFNDRGLRLSASRGETRAALLALKMAEMSILESEKGETPILLLDDVFAELDKHHSEALIDFIGDAQVLVTATDAEYIPKAFRDKANIIELSQASEN